VHISFMRVADHAGTASSSLHYCIGETTCHHMSSATRFCDQSG
jgi:hypothetical protein